ncbi:MAG: alpha/beta hydrolase, partial [Halobacteriales archaeon]|nr:alpha/beta hydrolase [Halobacteriales archaeon]
MDHETWTDSQETTTVTVDDHELRVAYYEADADHPDPPVVFLHGIPTWSFLFRAIVPALSGERHVIVPDLVGYGNSAMHDGFDRSIRAQEQVLEGLLAELAPGADGVDLVGHDIGGGIALRYAWHKPGVVDRLVLSNAACFDTWPVEFINSLGLPDTPRDRTLSDLEEDLDFVFGDGVYADEPDPAFVRGMKAPWLDAEGMVSITRCAVATNTNLTTEIDYGQIAAETLLLWGAEDILQPISQADRIADAD